MKRYTFSFTGRQAGAIGIFYKISDTYKANNLHEALSLLYMDYEHIKWLSILEGSKVIDAPSQIKWVEVRHHSKRPRKSDRATYAQDLSLS